MLLIVHDIRGLINLLGWLSSLIRVPASPNINHGISFPLGIFSRIFCLHWLFWVVYLKVPCIFVVFFCRSDGSAAWNMFFCFDKRNFALFYLFDCATCLPNGRFYSSYCYLSGMVMWYNVCRTLYHLRNRMFSR